MKTSQSEGTITYQFVIGSDQWMESQGFHRSTPQEIEKYAKYCKREKHRSLNAAKRERKLR